ncbi:MAG TPA: CPBP family intramembrane glutamic endopeptidase [Candidatus Dormibacteraeota bacterium]
MTRTTVASSWSWMRLDLPLRLVPLTLVPFVFSWLSGTPLRSLGLVITHPLRDLLVAVPAGVAGFAIAAAFNIYLSRRSGRWFVPTEPDLLVQSAYYLVLNAPIEEWFFRGFLQGSLAQWWSAPALAVLVTTVIFGAYHFLDRWGWRQVAGASAAGLALGLIYLWQPSPPSLLAPVLVHAAITCGFLSLGPYLVYRRRLRH